MKRAAAVSGPGVGRFAALAGRARAVRARVAGRGHVRVGAGARLGRGVRISVSGDAGRVELGEGCAIGAWSRIEAHDAVVTIGAGAALDPFCIVVARAGVEIGAGAVFAERVIVSDAELIADDVERPVRVQGLRAEPVAVGARARVGRAAVVTAGGRVADGAVVQPMAVVHGPEPDRAPGS